MNLLRWTRQGCLYPTHECIFHLSDSSLKYYFGPRYYTNHSLATVQEYNETGLRDISSGVSFKVEKLEMDRLSSYSGVLMKTF